MEQPQSKLLLIPGTGDSPHLAKNILYILRETYGMGNSVEMQKTMRGNQVQKGLKKAHTYPLVLDSFDDDETRVDIGRNLLLDRIRGTHVAIVKYMYTPKRRHERSINDHLMEVRGLLKVMKETETLKRTLVMPYIPYLRPHSVDKYKKAGFYQFDSLDMMLDDLHGGGLNDLIGIDPHSDKVIEVASRYGITTHLVDPFRSSETINPAKLGLDGRTADVLKTLQPFIEHYKKAKEQYGKIQFIIPDAGAEKRAEGFMIDCKRSVDTGLSWNDLGYRGKDRQTMEQVAGMFKSFSPINEDNIDPDVTYIILDDLLSSGSTAEEVARVLKENGAKRVEEWCSHAVAPKRKKVEDLEYLDKMVVLDTVLHEAPEKMKVEYINASADLLAAELYKAHMRLEEERFRV